MKKKRSNEEKSIERESKVKKTIKEKKWRRSEKTT